MPRIASGRFLEAWTPTPSRRQFQGRCEKDSNRNLEIPGLAFGPGMTAGAVNSPRRRGKYVRIFPLHPCIRNAVADSQAELEYAHALYAQFLEDLRARFGSEVVGKRAS